MYVYMFMIKYVEFDMGYVGSGHLKEDSKTVLTFLSILTFCMGVFG